MTGLKNGWLVERLWCKKVISKLLHMWKVKNEWSCCQYGGRSVDDWELYFGAFFKFLTISGCVATVVEISITSSVNMSILNVCVEVARPDFPDFSPGTRSWSPLISSPFTVHRALDMLRNKLLMLPWYWKKKKPEVIFYITVNWSLVILV